MNTLPTELLGAIFDSACSEPYPISKRHSDYPAPFPLLVAAVCRTWRHVALTTPSLWSHIYLDRKDATPGYLQLWTERSKSCLLDIVISDTLCLAAREILAPHAARWRSLIVQLRHFDAILLILSPFRGLHFPELRYLQIRNTCLEPLLDVPGQYYDTLFTHPMPSLREARINGMRFQRCIPILSGLRYLEISSFAPTHEEMCALVEASPDLETLVLPNFSCAPGRPSIVIQQTSGNNLAMTGTVLNGHSSSPAPRIEMPSIETFAISFDFIHRSLTCSCLLPSFSMPNLRHLEISGDGFTPHLPTHFPAHNPASLETLRLHCVDLQGTPGAGLASVFPSIKTLELVDVGNIKHLDLSGRDPNSNSKTKAWTLNTMPSSSRGHSPQPANQPLWPHLHRLRIDTAATPEVLAWLYTTVCARRALSQPSTSSKKRTITPFTYVSISPAMFFFYDCTRSAVFDALRTTVEVGCAALEEEGLVSTMAELSDDEEGGAWSSQDDDEDDDGITFEDLWEEGGYNDAWNDALGDEDGDPWDDIDEEE